MIIVICGPSGAGKGTIAEALLRRVPDLWLSRSWTTRPRRPTEPRDAYTFVDRAAFEARIAAGGFLEWDEHFDNLYGTPFPDAPAGSDVLLEIDVRGAEQVRARHPEALVIYVVAPSRSEQEARLRGRGESDGTIALRMKRADLEDSVAREIADVVVVNDDLDRAVAEVAGILEHRRSSHRTGSA